LGRAGAAAGHRIGRRVAAGAGGGVAAQAVEGVVGEAVPLERRVELVAAVGVAGADAGLAAEGVVGGGGQAAAPLAARVEADLAHHRSEEHTSELQSRENL